MGYEYKVKFAYEGADQVDTFLRALPHFDSFDEARQTYIYRTPENTGIMPDAEMSIETEGLYLCDYGMAPQQFGLLIKKLLSYFTSVQIGDWEL